MNYATSSELARLVVGEPSPFLAVYFDGDQLVHRYFSTFRALYLLALNIGAFSLEQSCDGSMTLTELAAPRIAAATAAEPEGVSHTFRNVSN